MSAGSPKPTYRIRDWSRHFETAESRRVTTSRWVAVPNKQDGKGYRRVAQHKNGVAIFCAWTLMLQVASKMPARGILADEDGALDADDLAAMTGFPARIFEQALLFLADSRVGWLELDNPENGKSVALLGASVARPADLRESPATPEKITPTEQNITVHNKTEQKEGKRRAKPRDERAQHPAIANYREIVGRYPDKALWDRVIGVIGPAPDLERMNECWVAWRARGYSPQNLSWLFEWYVKGIPEVRIDYAKRETASERNVRNLRESLAILQGGSGASSPEEPLGLVAADTNGSRERAVG